MQADLRRQIRLVVERLDGVRQSHRKQLRELGREERRIGADLRELRSAPLLPIGVATDKLRRQQQVVRQERRRLVNAHELQVSELQGRLSSLIRQFDALGGRPGGGR